MKLTMLKKSAVYLTSLLGWEKIQVKDEKLNLSDDEKAKLEKKLGKDMTANIIEAMNKEIELVAKTDRNAKQESEILKEMKEELSQVLKGTNMSQEEAEEIVSKGNNDESVPDSIHQLIQQVKANSKKQDQLIEKLMNDDEPDAKAQELTPKEKLMNMHSATHLFGSQKAYNAIDGRNWNKNAIRLAKGQKIKATDFTAEATIDKLNGDLDLYFRENPDRLNSLHRDNFGLPSFWPRRTDVDDKVADGNIVSSEISQVRKASWLPKNKQLIQPEERKIFPVQIDIELKGYDLQKIEASWLNMMNREGSSPFKTTFVNFLVNELDKKARVEDRKSSIKGVHVALPDNATKAGKAINRQDGLLYQLWKGIKIDKKVQTRNIGKPTPTNIVDHVQANVEGLPEEVRELNLPYYLEPEHLRWYKTRKRQLHGVENDFSSSDVMTVENYPNIYFVPLHDLAGTSLHFITFDNNIEIMEKLPNEKSLYRFQQKYRDTIVMGDYKLGIGFKHLGTKVQPGDPDEFKVQTVWTNGINPFPENYFVPAYSDGSQELSVKYSNIKLDESFNTDIIDLKDVKAGQVVKIKGDTNIASGKKIAKSGKFSTIASNFEFNTGGTLTLYVKSDLTFKELKRTTQPDLTPSEVYEFTGDTIDMTDGSTQHFTDSSNQTLAEILNGVDGNELTIVRKGSGNLTISNGNTISVSSGAVLDAADDSIKLVLIEGVWTEVERNISA